MRIIGEDLLEKFRIYLYEEEKSDVTIEKYMRDMRCFRRFLNGRPVEKSVVLEYKKWLRERYSIASANSMLAAINGFFRCCGWTDCRARYFKMQKKIFTPENREITREEYQQLVRTARERGDARLELIMQTICATGIRISELRFITVEAVRKGEAEVSCKGKSRIVFLIPELQRKLTEYIEENGVEEGPCFLTRRGVPVSRQSVWRAMKKLCEQACVRREKVFPHNLRHLFARVFYGLDKDIVRLADVLGHSNINTTRIYVMTTGQEHRRKMQSMQLII